MEWDLKAVRFSQMESGLGQAGRRRASVSPGLEVGAREGQDPA